MIKGENRVGMGIDKVGVALVLLFSGDSPAVARAVGSQGLGSNGKGLRTVLEVPIGKGLSAITCYIPNRIIIFSVSCTLRSDNSSMN